MDLNEMMSDMDTDKENEQSAGGQENESFNESFDEVSVPSKKKSMFSKKSLTVAAFLIIAVILAAGYFLFFKKKSNNFLNGPGGSITISNKPPAPQDISNSLINAPAGGENKKNHNTLSKKSSVVKTNAKDMLLSAGTPIMGRKTPAAKVSNKKNLNDLFTVKYHNNNFNSMNPVMSSPLPPMPAQVPSVPNFSMPNLKNMANKLKGMDGFKTVSLTISGYAAGMVAAKCGGGTHYLKAGNSICGWTLLNANSNHAVFSQDKQIKKINY